MKTRIISALVATVGLVAVLLCPWKWVFALVAALATGLAAYELLHNTGIAKNKWMIWGSVLFSFTETLTLSFSSIGLRWSALLAGIYAVYTLVLFCAVRKNFLWESFGLTLYATIGFGALGMLRLAGLRYVLLPMVIAWMSDTGAYFVGTFFGKHKMAPVISPKKSWEGFFGGWLISVGLTVLYGAVCNAALDPTFGLVWLAVVATVLAPLSVLGDLLASVIKRRTGIKDYGSIMPGHGGVMDRFDSVVLIAPLVLMALVLF